MCLLELLLEIDGSSPAASTEPRNGPGPNDAGPLWSTGPDSDVDATDPEHDQVGNSSALDLSQGLAASESFFGPAVEFEDIMPNPRVLESMQAVIDRHRIELGEIDPAGDADADTSSSDDQSGWQVGEASYADGDEIGAWSNDGGDSYSERFSYDGGGEDASSVISHQDSLAASEDGRPQAHTGSATTRAGSQYGSARPADELRRAPENAVRREALMRALVRGQLSAGVSPEGFDPERKSIFWGGGGRTLSPNFGAFPVSELVNLRTSYGDYHNRM